MCTAVPLSQAESLLLYPIFSRLEGWTSATLRPLSLGSSLSPFPPLFPLPQTAYVCTAACFSHARLLKDFFLTCQEKLSSIAIYPVLILLDRDRVHSQEGYIL